MVDTIKTKYYIWPPRRVGPDYTFDLDKMVYTMFGVKIKIDGMRSINWVVDTGQILKDGKLKVGKEKYKIIVGKNTIDFNPTNCLEPTIKDSEKIKDKPTENE